MKVAFGKITVFLGPNDAGKSAAIRALMWVMANDFKGKEFISWGKTFAKVTLKVDGHTIIRKKGKRSNLYFLDGKKLSAVGTKVPEEVAKILNLGSDNFQSQMDSPFWFSETAGQVSKKLNKIINLEVIDDSLKTASTKVNKAKDMVSFITDRQIELEKRKKELKWILDVDEELSTIERMDAKSIKLDVQIKNLTSTIETIAKHKKAIRTLEDACVDVARLLGLLDKANNVDAKIKSLSGIITSIKETQKIANKELPVKEITRIGSLCMEAEEIDSSYEALKSILGQIHLQQENLCQAKRQFGNLEAKLHRQLKGRCPICHRKLPIRT